MKESDERIIGGGFLHTFGNSQAAINLMGNILAQAEYKPFKPRICRLLSKQSEAFNSLMAISNIRIRKAALEIWHKKFTLLTEGLPEIVKTHTCCVETGIYRRLLKS